MHRVVVGSRVNCRQGLSNVFHSNQTQTQGDHGVNVLLGIELTWVVTGWLLVPEFKGTRQGVYNIAFEH